MCGVVRAVRVRASAMGEGERPGWGGLGGVEVEKPADEQPEGLHRARARLNFLPTFEQPFVHLAATMGADVSAVCEVALHASNTHTHTHGCNADAAVE